MSTVEKLGTLVDHLRTRSPRSRNGSPQPRFLDRAIRVRESNWSQLRKAYLRAVFGSSSITEKPDLPQAISPWMNREATR